MQAPEALRLRTAAIDSHTRSDHRSCCCVGCFFIDVVGNENESEYEWLVRNCRLSSEREAGDGGMKKQKETSSGLC